MYVLQKTCVVYTHSVYHCFNAGNRVDTVERQLRILLEGKEIE